MKVLIYSKEHSAWWRANSQGYATNLACAGLYESDEAASIEKGSHGRDRAVSLEKAFQDLQQQAWGADRALSDVLTNLGKAEAIVRDTNVLRRT